MRALTQKVCFMFVVTCVYISALLCKGEYKPCKNICVHACVSVYCASERVSVCVCVRVCFCSNPSVIMATVSSTLLPVPVHFG